MLSLDFDLTAFIGRDQERARLEDLLAQRRLVTIVGPGGTGKTRMAVELVRSIGERFAGARFVELASVGDPSLVAIEVTEGTGAELIVVDNCEHVLSAAADAVRRLLEANAEATVLATSREPLGIGGETVVPLDPLGVPSARAGLHEVRASDAVRMFIDRARLANPRFDVTGSNADAVADLCRELDGLPLALELVAPYMRALTPANVLQRIRDLGIRGVPSRDSSAHRQATLTATIEWSYSLLTEEERKCLSALGVFSGRFTLEGVQRVVPAVGVEPERVMDLLVALVDKSLVRVHHSDNETWYSLLEMVRSFAWSTLDETHDDGLRLEREGELWRISHGDTSFLMRDSKGLGYISRLMTAQGAEIAAVELATPGGADASTTPLEAIDPEAKAAYQRRLDLLDEEIRTAGLLEDDDRLARASQEREALVAELARSVGLGGRIRRQGGDAERARMAVTKAIRSAIDKIAEQDEQVADLLNRSIKTGSHCSYRPPS